MCDARAILFRQKPESSVRDIVNITAVAVIDAIVEKKKANK